jgi:acyl-coenzyme A synthetase/AMP-(fatty) acid ligase/acyl carrier protein
MTINPDQTVSRHLADAAARWADHGAMTDGQLTLSYRELLAAVQQVAQLVRHDEPAAAAPVAVIGGLDAWTIVGMLGVLWSGRILSVLDGKLPAERQTQVLDILQPGLLLYSRTPPPPSAGRLPQIDLSGIDRTPPAQPVTAHDQLHTPAIVTFSTGTTGAPKGVIRSQAVLLRHMLIYSAQNPPQPGDSVALLYHPAFSSAAADIYPTLFGGATLQIIDPADQSAQQLRDRLLTADLTHLHLHASLLRPLADVLPSGTVFRRLCALRPSEHTDGADLRRFLHRLPGDCIVSHTLSSSETGPITHVARRADADWPNGLLPVGVPLHDLTLRLLDDAGNDVAPGTIGRIQVSSPGVALGYWRDPERTAQVFRATDDPAIRVFESADLACLLPSGDLQLHGRADRRVKIRGHSVALDAVEQTLSALPDVGAAATVALPDRQGNLQLFAYVSPVDGRYCDPLRLMTELRRRREAALLPRRIIVLAQLPRHANGKIDYRALPAPERTRLPSAVPYAPPDHPFTEQIAAIWADVLELEPIGIDDEFTALGGDSIRALQLLHRLEQLHGRDLPANLLREGSTVRRQAALLQQAVPAAKQAPQPAVPRTAATVLRRAVNRTIFALLYGLVLLLLQTGIIDRRYARQRRLLQQLSTAYGCQLPEPDLWRRSVLADMLLNKPFWRGPYRYLSFERRHRYDRLIIDGAAVTFVGLSHLIAARRAGTGAILVTYHGVSHALRRHRLAEHLGLTHIPTISAARADVAARRDGRPAAVSRGDTVFDGLAVLRSGGVVTFASDSVQRSDQNYCLRFHAATRSIGPGFAEAALLSGASVLPIHHRCDRHGRVSIIIGAPFARPDPTTAHEAQISILLQQYLDWLAARIAEDPASLQWRHLPRELVMAPARRDGALE